MVGCVPHHEEDNALEELEHHHGEDEELDGQPVDLVIVLDLARSVDPGEVIFVHTVLHDEEQQSWGRRVYKITVHSSGLVLTEWCDERTGYGENDDHGKYQHHPGIMLAKPELQSDVSPDRRNLSLTSRQTELDEIPEQLGKPKYF